MARKPPIPSRGPEVPERGVKAATYRLLMDTAADVIRQDGHVPTVAEVAVRSRCRAQPPIATSRRAARWSPR